MNKQETLNAALEAVKNFRERMGEIIETHCEENYPLHDYCPEAAKEIVYANIGWLYTAMNKHLKDVSIDFDQETGDSTLIIPSPFALTESTIEEIHSRVGDALYYAIERPVYDKNGELWVTVFFDNEEDLNYTYQNFSDFEYTLNDFNYKAVDKHIINSDVLFGLAIKIEDLAEEE